MSADFEEFSKLMLEEMKKAYSKKAFDYIIHPRNLGSLGNANGYGEATDAHGDKMHIWLEVDKDIITRAGFWTTGCTTLLATGSALTELVKGLSIEAADRLTPRHIVQELAGLPPKTEHCADISLGALGEAIKSYVLDSFLKNTLQDKPNYRHLQLEL